MTCFVFVAGLPTVPQAAAGGGDHRAYTCTRERERRRAYMWCCNPRPPGLWAANVFFRHAWHSPTNTCSRPRSNGRFMQFFFTSTFHAGWQHICHCTIHANTSIQLSSSWCSRLRDEAFPRFNQHAAGNRVAIYRQGQLFFLFNLSLISSAGNAINKNATNHYTISNHYTFRMQPC